MSQSSVNPSPGSDARPDAYSYVRFSTLAQELGDSLRRQVDLARRYALENNLRLNERSFRDLGVSGFRGRNVEAGALGAFIAAVKSGLIPRGSYLLIEQFDRLSRDHVNKALRLLLDLVEDYGITVVTLVDGKVWNSETVQDMTNVLISVILMSRAHEESKSKSKRLTEVWGEKKTAAAEGRGERIVTSECPRWMRPTADKTGFELVPELADSVRRVYAMRLAGHGVSSIVTRANTEGWPVPGKQPLRLPGETWTEYAKRAPSQSWHTSLVGRLLRNRAVLGEYQPHRNMPDGKRTPVGDSIAGYYPSIIDEQTFLRVQAVAERRGAFPGRRDASYKNWLQGLLRCACGNTMVRKNKNSLAQPNYARYYCSARNRGVSTCAGANAGQLESAVLHVVSARAPAHFDGHRRSEEIKAQLDLLSVEIAAARSKRDRLTEAVAESTTPVKSILPLLARAELEVEEAEERDRTLRAEASDIAADADAVFASIARRASTLASLDDRAELREDLARVISRVEVHEPAGYIRVWLRGDDEIPIVQPLRPDGAVPGLSMEPPPGWPAHA